MKIELTVKKEFDIKYLQAQCGVRYWEDATINGVEDEKGDLTPLRKGANWEPLIELETGKIKDWPNGTTADIHFKICDNGCYKLLADDMSVVAEIDDYVPQIMCPDGNGYGDYVIMKIDGNGIIANWEPCFDEFLSEED